MEMTMKYAVDESLVLKARELGLLIREHAPEAEQQRRLSKAVMDALNSSGITKMLLPRSLGGLETDPVTMLRVVEEVASFDSVAGWLLMVSNSGAHTAARFPVETVEELFRDPNDWLIATAFQPPVEAREVDGGYRLTGQRALASYAHAARWICLTGLVMDGSQPRMAHGMPVLIVAIMPAKDVEVLDTWHGLGMRGTDSTDVSVRDLFVPRAFSCPLAPTFEPNEHYRSAVYTLPMLAPIVLATLPPVAIAIARNAIEEVKVLSAKRTPMASAVALRDRGAAQERLGRAEAMLRSARSFMYETMADTWARTQAGQAHTLAQRADILLAAAHAGQVSAEVTDMMFASGGSAAVFVRHPLERLFRDSQVIRQHGFVTASRYETVAQVMLGLEPDLPLIHF
jgi:alkylation response protein AidB-like acyl-CoA dehydrogenase